MQTEREDFGAQLNPKRGLSEDEMNHTCEWDVVENLFILLQSKIVEIRSA